MTPLAQYFQDKPRGAKADLAAKLGISRTWLSLLVSGREACSPELAVQIHQLTGGGVRREDLRPDLFGAVR